LTGRRRDDGAESFADAMDDVVPLEDRDKIRTPPAAPTPARRAAAARPVRFLVERRGAGVEARVESVSRKTLARLRRGEIPVDIEIDLHGLGAQAARRELVERLQAIRTGGARCALVIHGTGHHSQEEPVLRNALPEWLQRAPIAEIVTAFASAPAGLGGSGATLVLLRRAR
jgi:DNA-nicking Smr family endonuclease